MGLTYSVKINVDKEAIEEFAGGLDTVMNEYREEKEKIQAVNQKVNDTVDNCVKLYMDHRLLGCDNLFMFSDKRKKCNDNEYDLLQCTTTYMKLLGEKY